MLRFLTFLVVQNLMKTCLFFMTKRSLNSIRNSITPMTKVLIFKRERSKNPFGLVTLNTRIFLTTMSAGIVVIQDTIVTHVPSVDINGMVSLLM